jgi:hypothetical protein
MNTATDTQTRVLLSIDDNEGYAPEQVDTTLTLGDLIAALQEAADEHGEDAIVVLNNGQRYGASFGRFTTMAGEIVDITATDEDED